MDRKPVKMRTLGTISVHKIVYYLGIACRAPAICEDIIIMIINDGEKCEALGLPDLFQRSEPRVCARQICSGLVKYD